MRDPKAGMEFAFYKSTIETISEAYKFFNLGIPAQII